MNIDETTGLPELPEGYFWRVNRQSVEIRKTLPNTEWRRAEGWGFSFESYYTEGKRETRTVSKTKIVESRVGLFKKRIVKTEIPYDSPEERRVDRSQAVTSAKTEVIGKTPSVGSYYGDRYYRYYDVHADITKDNILPLAKKAFEQFEAQNLYGDYPPKKLEP